MRLTKLTGHAIRLLVHCAGAGDGLVKTSAVSAELGITGPNLFKIVHILSHAGFIKTVRGPRGGIGLARPADTIRISEVVRATEVTSVEIAGWTEGGAKGHRPGKGNGTPINTVLDEALEAFVSVLDQHTLADMAPRSKPNTSKRSLAKASRLPLR